MDEQTKVIRRDKNKKGKPRRRSAARTIGRVIGRTFLVLFLLLVTVAIVAGGAGIGFLYGLMREMPTLEEIGAPKPSLTSFVYSADGEVIAELHRWQNRVPVALSDVPVSVQNAFIAAEDHRFWEHRGTDPIRVVGAAYTNLKAWSFKEGFSTITMQVVKNAYTGPRKTIQRKLQDVVLAFQMERRYTKTELLEMYLNLSFFGHDAHGIQAAAQTYFGKDVGQLTLGEGALLAGILPAANDYSPYVDKKAGLGRQHLVLDLMVRYGFITDKEAEAAKAEPLKLRGLVTDKSATYQSPHFTDYVLQQLVDMYGPDMVYEGGLHVYTTVDLEIQRAAELAVAEVLAEDFPLPTDEDEDKDREYPEMAAVVLDPHTGAIIAMVGGRTHAARLELNRVTQSYRQPGSAFKPLVYVPAVDMGMTVATIIDDAPVQYRQFDGSVWAPMNYDFRFRGLTPFRDGIASSINVMAVRLADQIGVRSVIEYAHKLGITSLVTSGPVNDLNLAMSLGGITRGVSPMELTSAFGVFAADGVRAVPFGIARVVDAQGTLIYRADPALEVVLRPGTGYIMSNMLQSAVEVGTGRNAKVEGHAIAGKTGTTSDHVDAWFVGFSPDIACGVWMGYDQPKDMGVVWGGTYPAAVFQRIMTVALADVEPRPFTKPSGLVEGVRVCTKSGKRAGPLCPPENARMEIFLRGTQPQEECDVHVEQTICKESGLLATDNCPPSSVVTRVFIHRPEPSVPYTDERGRTFTPADAVNEAPTEYCTLHSPRRDTDEGDQDDDDADEQAAVDLVILNMTAQRYVFQPGQIRIGANRPVELRLTAVDTDHGIEIPALGIDLRVPHGETRSITFVVDTPGIYAFFNPVDCGPDSHRMVGQLVVSN